ncbi:MAG: multicopper oxidase domain-containing protein [Thermodesulfobacteriota bacterium]
MREGSPIKKKFNRRDFFKTLTGATVVTATTAGAIMAAEKSPLNDSESNTPFGMDLTQDPFPRIELGRKYSPPPPLMGRQMGTVNTLSQAPLGYEMDGDVKVFKLIAQPVTVPITKGTTKAERDSLRIKGRYKKFSPRPTYPKEMIAWGYNGICPGPTLEAIEGDRVRIILKNELPEPTSIHWHGFELPYAQDGADGYRPFNARLPVLPRDTREYEFTLYQSGTLLYHPGFNVMKQDGIGLSGMFVIHPKNPPHKIDKDFAILLQTWNFSPGNPNPDITNMDVSFATFNGKTAPDIEMMNVNQGERIRIRIGNLSLSPHPIHLHGYTFNIVGTTGGPIKESAQWPEATVNVPPGTTRDIELIAWNPGTWRFHCHVLHHIMNAMTDMPMGIAPDEGMFTYLHVIPKEPGYDPKNPNAPWQPPTKEETE